MGRPACCHPRRLRVGATGPDVSPAVSGERQVRYLACGCTRCSCAVGRRLRQRRPGWVCVMQRLSRRCRFGTRPCPAWRGAFDDIVLVSREALCVVPGAGGGAGWRGLCAVCAATVRRRCAADRSRWCDGLAPASPLPGAELASELCHAAWAPARRWRLLPGPRCRAVRSR